MILNPVAGCTFLPRRSKSTSTYDMREMVPEKGSLGYPVPVCPPTKISSPRLLDLDPRYRARRPVSSRKRRDPSARSWGCTDRHSSIPNFGKADGRTSGDAMWRSRRVATLLYTSVCTRGWHYAGARTSRRARDARKAARPTACPPQECPIHVKLMSRLVERVQNLLDSPQQKLIIDFFSSREIKELVYAKSEVWESK